METLNGYKTYILGAAGLITVALTLFNVIDANTANVLLSLFGFSGLITLRAAVK